ncbi:hypothetical protein Tco_1511419, partial [Tanacetum coccineum]
WLPDEQQQTRSGTNEGAGDKPEVPDVPEYRSESEEESWTFSQGEDEEEDEEHDSDDDNDDNDDEDDVQEHDSQRTESDDSGDDFVHPNLSTYKADEEEQEKEEEKAEDDDEVISDQKVSTPPDYELTEEDENQQDDDTMGGEQEDEELYGDLNINLNRRDAEMTDAQINQETEEAHVTLTTEPPVVQQQSSSVSSDLVAKFINPSPDTALSSIPGIVDNHLTSKMKDEVNVALQLKSDKLRKEAHVENQDFLNSLDSNMKRIIKEQDVMIKTKMKNPPLDQIEGQSEEDQARKSHQEKQLKRRQTLHVFLKEFDTGNDVSPVREVTNVDKLLWNPSGSRTPDREWNQTKTVDDRP